MTERELQAEWRYRYEERLGIMCGDGDPTDEQRGIAMAEADEAIEKLKQND